MGRGQTEWNQNFGHLLSPDFSICIVSWIKHEKKMNSNEKSTHSKIC